MAPNQRYDWSPQEDQQLREYAARPAEWIAGQIGRSPTATYRRLIKLGLKKHKSRLHSFWNAERDADLRAKVDRNISRVKIAAMFGVTEWVVRMRCQQLGIIFQPSGFLKNDPRRRGLKRVDPDDGDPVTIRERFVKQDEAFQIALMAAVVAGTETLGETLVGLEFHPCWLGIDKTPCTKRPTFVPTMHEVLHRSSAGWMRSTEGMQI